jgi:hypothetical protein
MRTTTLASGAGLENNLGAVVRVTNGGKPNKGTKADKRLKENKGVKAGKKLSTSGMVTRVSR